MFHTGNPAHYGKLMPVLSTNLKQNGLKKSSFNFTVLEQDGHGRKWVNASVNGSNFSSQDLMYVDRLDAMWRERLIATTMMIMANNGLVELSVKP